MNEQLDRTNDFTERTILLNDYSVKNELKRWKMNDHFEYKQNYFLLND